MSAINQKEYLKKYLSLGSEPGKKKKRKKKSTAISDRVKIIDDNIDVVLFNQAVEEDLNAQNEDAPQIVGVIDDRPLELRISDYRDSDLWKPVGSEDGQATAAGSSIPYGEATRVQKSQKRTSADDDSQSKTEKYNDDYSPPRKQSRWNDNTSTRHEDAKSSSPSRDRKDTKRRNSDFSPPRSNRRSNDDISAHKRNERDNDNGSKRESRGVNDVSRNRSDDVSPQRRNRRNSDASPPRRNRKNSDATPPRKNRWDSDVKVDKRKVTPPRRNRWDDDGKGERKDKRRNSDASPPRRDKKNSDSSSPQRNKNQSDTGTERRNRQNSDQNPRQRNRRNSDASPPRRSRRDSDATPPRKNVDKTQRDKRDSDAKVLHRDRRNSDASPPRKSRWNNTPSPPPRNKNYSGASIDRKSKQADTNPSKRDRRNSDASPPRRSRKNSGPSPPRRRDFDMSKDSSSWRRSPSPKSRSSRSESQIQSRREGHRIEDQWNTGDQYGDNRNRINEEARESFEASSFQRTSPSPPPSSSPPTSPPPPTYPVIKITGPRRANDIITGKDRSCPARIVPAGPSVLAPIMRDRQTGKIRDLKKEEEEAKKKRDQEDELKAKYAKWGKGLKQVEDANEQLNSDLREMDKPLARYADDEDLERYLKEMERDGDPMLEYLRKKRRRHDVEAGKPIKPQFEGEFMPNRYGIRPGHRWDGVDRSNGYERKWFEVMNSRRAQLEDAYKWSTEDM